MNLLIDLGNTRAKITLCAEDGRIVQHFERKSLSVAWLTDLFNTFLITRSILCSVVAHSSEIVDFLAAKTDFVLLTHETPLPIKLEYATPHTLGKDRISGSCGAWQRFPNSNNLVIDAGTCIKYDFTTAEGNYIGGSISAGISMRFRAMHEFTAKLPLVTRQRLDGFVGYNTETALRTGTQLGAALEAKGFIELYTQRYDALNIIVTGGDAPYLLPYLPRTAVHDKFLIIKGLHAILQNI